MNVKYWLLIVVGMSIVLLMACSPSTVPPTPSNSAITPTNPSKTEITLADNGQTFTYSVTSRFLVFLDSQAYPPNEFVCQPEGIIGQVSNGTGLYNPDLKLTSVGFEAVKPGVCVLRNRDFHITIQVTD